MIEQRHRGLDIKSVGLRVTLNRLRLEKQPPYSNAIGFPGTELNSLP